MRLNRICMQLSYLKHNYFVYITLELQTRIDRCHSICITEKLFNKWKSKIRQTVFWRDKLCITTSINIVQSSGSDNIVSIQTGW